jgi:heme-degrading monooxygenase HmoA
MTAIIRSITDAAPRGAATNHAFRGATAHSRRASTQEMESTVVVFSSFLVSPSEAPIWIHNWHGLAATAETWPGCRSFRLVRDRNDDMYMAALSEWDNLDAYRSFVHATGDRWGYGAMGHTIMAGESRFLEIIPEESPLQAAY